MREVVIEPWRSDDLPEMVRIWNTVVASGTAFPQEELLDLGEAEDFFAGQSITCVARLRNSVVGLYILHPNNVGRCSHIANASYAVAENWRGNGIGEELVRDSLQRAKTAHFLVLQFNAVAKSNQNAHKLYDKLGFVSLGVVPRGFRNIAGELEDICLYYHLLD